MTSSYWPSGLRYANPIDESELSAAAYTRIEFVSNLPSPYRCDLSGFELSRKGPGVFSKLIPFIVVISPENADGPLNCPELVFKLLIVPFPIVALPIFVAVTFALPILPVPLILALLILVVLA